jgi:hypothetical protein
VDALRQQLREIVESLGSRDLEKVIAFAEFVKARRAARGFAARPDPQALAEPESSDKPADETPPSDYEPPSSQQRTASR